MLELTFEIEGEVQLLRRLEGIRKDLKDWRPEFKKTGSMLLKTFKENFSTQGATLGDKWQRLASSTIREKVRLGYSGAGPLVRTGKMKRGFRSRPSSESVEISNPIPYFGYHQSKGPRTNLPRRVMMKLDERRKQQVVKIFQSSVRHILQAR